MLDAIFSYGPQRTEKGKRDPHDVQDLSHMDQILFGNRYLSADTGLILLLIIRKGQMEALHPQMCAGLVMSKMYYCCWHDISIVLFI